MKRRDFITLVGGATAVWPLAVRAQQRPTASIGVLGLGTLEQARRNFGAIRPGLAELGYVEGKNLTVHFRGADYHAERLAALATDCPSSDNLRLVRRFAKGSDAFAAAKL